MTCCGLSENSASAHAARVPAVQGFWQPYLHAYVYAKYQASETLFSRCATAEETFTMLAHLKLALLCAVLALIVAMSTVEAARQLLDRYDDCRGG